MVLVGICLRRDRCQNIHSRIAGGVPSEAHRYLRGPYAITVGQPTQYEGNVEDHEQVRWTSETIMERIRHLAHESERRMRSRKVASSPI